MPQSGQVGKNEDGQYTRTEIPDQIWIERQAYTVSVLELADSLERIAAYPMLDGQRTRENY